MRSDHSRRLIALESTFGQLSEDQDQVAAGIEFLDEAYGDQVGWSLQDRLETEPASKRAGAIVDFIEAAERFDPDAERLFFERARDED